MCRGSVLLISVKNLKAQTLVQQRFVGYVVCAGGDRHSDSIKKRSSYIYIYIFLRDLLVCTDLLK